MDSVRLIALEQRLLQVETDLAASHRLIDDLRQGATRSRFLGRITSSLSACGLIAILAITVGTTKAAPGPQVLTVKAPFAVQNEAGQIVFQVTAKGGPGIAKVLDGEGKKLVALQPNESGGSGEVAVAGAKSGQVARLSSYAGDLSLRFYTGANLLAGIGTYAGSGVLQVNSKAGKLMAKMASNGTSGTVGIYNADGKPKGLLATDTKSGDGEFDLFYADGTTPAVQLAEVAAGGYVAVTNRAGIARVELGTLASDQGIVRADGPGGFDYIRGEKVVLVVGRRLPSWG